MNASDTTLNEAAESSTPAPSDMNAAMARCGSGVFSPRTDPTSAPDAAASPQHKAHAAPTMPSGTICRYACCATLSARIGSLQWGRTKWQV